MKQLFLYLIASLLVNQINAQHLRARPAGSREATRRTDSRQSIESNRQRSRQPQLTSTTTTTPAPIASHPEDETGKYYGTYLGSFETKLHGVLGEIFAVDESTVFVKNFKYDGEGPDAYFWGGSTDLPDENGFIIPDEKGSTKPLAKYTGQNLVLRLPEGKTLRDLNYIAVWCKKVSANFGHLDLKNSKTATIPTAIEIRPLSQLDHGVKSGPINIIDAQTFLITDFHYDGDGPFAYFWTSKGDKQNSKGTKIPDENNSLKPLKRYSGETVVITLPDNKTIYDFDFFGVWCEEYFVDFGHTRIPHNILVPPSAKMLGVKHEVLYGDLSALYNNETETTIATTTTTTTTTAAPLLRSSLNHNNRGLVPSRGSTPYRGFTNNRNPNSSRNRNLDNNNHLINRSIVESARLQTGTASNSRGGRRPPQRKPQLDAKPTLDRFEHNRPIVPVSNAINSSAGRNNFINREILSNNLIKNRATINRQVANNLVVNTAVNAAIPNTSLVSNSRQMVSVSNSINALTNNIPINSLISNPIGSSIPVNHLAPANSFIPINNNLITNNLNTNVDSITLTDSVSSSLTKPAVANNVINNNSISSPIHSSPISANPINSNPNSITRIASVSNAINKPVVRDRQNIGILEFNTKPERTTTSIRPRPERINSIESNRGRAVSRSSSRATSRITETSISNEPNSIDELNLPSGGSGFGSRIRG